MWKRFDDRSGTPEEGVPEDDPRKDFPKKESFADFSGAPRQFEIAMHELSAGYLVDAVETGKDIGYRFSAFDATSPYIALGHLRVRMHRALSTRHVEAPDGRYSSTHDTLRGHITGDPESGEPIFVIDGQGLSLADLAKIANTYEGFQFRLDFIDSTDEVP